VYMAEFEVEKWSLTHEKRIIMGNVFSLENL
jgi:hypothetical protein